MRLTVPEIECNNGFTPENDIFNRKPFSIQLENIIENSDDDNLVIALNEKWGNGKTTFLKMWETEISKHKKFNVVYFDAFQNDFQTDPFIAIASHIYAKIESEDAKKKYLRATKKVASVLMKTSLKVGISALTLGIAKGSDFEELGGDISSAINDPLENYIEEKITQLDKENNTLEHFRSTLSEIAAEKKLIFIIDELDRARPNYSLELLERIKHVFNTKNIFFVLSTDKEQFMNVIQKTYGSIDANMYLNKFVHLWMSLPKNDSSERRSYVLSKYINYINKRILSRDLNLQTSLDVLSYLLRVNKFSLRDAERCYSLLLLCNANVPNGFKWEYQVGVAIAVFLKLKDETILENIKDKLVTKQQLMEQLGITQIPEDENYHILLAVNTEYLTREGYAKAVREGEQMIFRDAYGQQPLTISHAIDIIYNVQ
ncbi:KAP family P-loop NTPase fold protein [Enterobacter chuandaensis]|uniref:KAP family P-loop NTPase fold protein n=1 Tax=Enterobacter chuandaensis TaxID=2497875 RepID=UPI001C2E5053|nr:P-loop NTPase fold protein [Enterobacter chuandaensis]